MNKYLTVLKILVLMVPASLPALSAHAGEGESISQVALNAQQKQSLISFLQQRIARHKKMNFEQITAEFNASANRNRQVLAKRGEVDLTKWDKATVQSMDQLKAMGDKGAIVMLETTQLQQLMTSGNYLFSLTRGFWESPLSIGDEYVSHGEPIVIGLGIFVSIFTIPVDILLLPVTFIMSAVTGF